MAVCTIANARAATVGAGGRARVDSSVSWFQTRTRLSPVAARAGSGRPTLATSPRARMRTRPLTVVRLRISRPFPGLPPPPGDADAGITRRVLEPWRGQGQGTGRWGGSGPAVHPPRTTGPDRQPARSPAGSYPYPGGGR